MTLFKQRRFLPYFITQFLGAFNDNVFKNALVIIFTYQLVSQSSSSSVLVNIAALIFILPFFLFSPLAGQLADKYEKSALIRKIKWLEIIIMLLGCLGLYLNSTSVLLGVLFLMGTQSAFFGPIKYSILPQHLKREELLDGNAVVEAGTFLAILFGTILGGILAAQSSYVVSVSITIVFLAIMGRIAAQWVPAAKPAQPDLLIDRNIISSTKSIFSGLLQDHSNFLTALGISWFWFFGATFLTQFPNFAREVLNGDAYVATLLMAMFSIGIGLGSFLSSKLSNNRVEIGLVPFGAFGMTVFALMVGFAEIPIAEETRSVMDMLLSWSTLKILLALMGIAVFGGMFIVPLKSYLQINTPDEYRSRNIAASNMMDAIFLILAAVFAIACLSIDGSIQNLFINVALMNVAVALFIFFRAPEFILRTGAWLLVHSIYRIGKHDLKNIPREGPALLICNHISFVDPVILGAIVDRPVRFVMYHKIYELPIAHKLFKQAKAIPIASAKVDAELLKKAYDDIADTLERGELVCIFPEGGLTPDGDIQDFKRGTEKILARTPVPVIPMALQGLWGTWFSRYGGRAMKGWPRNWLKKITLKTGEIVQPKDAKLELLQRRVEVLRGDAK